MKSLIYLLAFCFVLLSGCAKDALEDENGDLKKAMVTKPMKAWFCMTPNPDLPPIHIANTPDVPENYMPGGGFISGHATHCGEVISGLSPSIMTELYFDVAHFMDTGEMRIVQKATGRITAANGDSYRFTTTCYISMADMTFTGPVYMDDGTGKFKGMTGTVEMTGQGSCWTAEGFITYN